MSDVKLTERQRIVAEMVVGGCTPAEAYRKGLNRPNAKNAAALGRKMIERPHVQAYMERLREQRRVHTIDKQWLTANASDLLSAAKERGQVAAGVQALNFLAKLHGQMVEKSEVRHSPTDGMTREEMEAELKRLMSPEPEPYVAPNALEILNRRAVKH